MWCPEFLIGYVLIAAEEWVDLARNSRARANARRIGVESGRVSFHRKSVIKKSDQIKLIWRIPTEWRLIDVHVSILDRRRTDESRVSHVELYPQE